MTPEQFLERLAAVRIDRSHGGRAPHKPLMLLLALGRVRLGPKSRLIPYETADSRFKELWQEFGRPGKQPRAYYPFWQAAKRRSAVGDTRRITTVYGSSG